MGVDLGDLAVRKTISLESLAGRTVAIDAFNTIYQFLSSIRQEDGNPLMDYKGRITAHLSGLFYRNARLLENGIRPVYVFDGKPPEFKRKTQQMRAAIKKEAEEKWMRALEEGRPEDAKKFWPKFMKKYGSKALLLIRQHPLFDDPVWEFWNIMETLRQYGEEVQKEMLKDVAK